MYIHPHVANFLACLSQCSVTVRKAVFLGMILYVFKEFQVTKLSTPIRCQSFFQVLTMKNAENPQQPNSSQLLSITHYNSHVEKIKVHSSENITHHPPWIYSSVSQPTVHQFSTLYPVKNSLLHSAFSQAQCHYCLENYCFYNMCLH